MPAARARSLLDHAQALLREVLRFDAAADAAVAAYVRRHPGLGPRERQLLADTAFAALRRLPLWRHLARDAPGAVERRIAALAWAGDTDALARSLDADERAWLDAARACDVEALPDTLRHHLPDWLAAALRAQLADDEFWTLAHALLAPAPLDLRVNVLKARRDAARAALADAGIAAEPTPYSPWGLRVQGKPSLRGVAALQRGEVEVQDEGSQLLALLSGSRRGETVVDFCAGAGGKTLALGAMMRGSGRLYAFDVSASRLAALQPRLQRAGIDHVYPMAIAHERDERVQRLAGKVDRVLVDAPCSGLGTLRRNPDLKWRHTPHTVEALAATQRALLDAAARLLAPGGRLVYATCSLLAAENEAVADAFGADHPRWRPLDAAALLQHAGVADAASLAPAGRLRLWPHRHGTDGFFAAVWQRP
ncbi:MAG: RsmB/NOP family class I SAM-dependent RNA methyltransferase [Gammaproteobacteria bacterium]